MMAMFGVRLSQPILKTILGLALQKLVAWVTCSVCMTIMKTLCALALTMKSFGAMNAHIFQSSIRWHYLHLLPPLHANSITLLLYVLQIV